MRRFRILLMQETNNLEKLRFLVESYYDIQDVRISVSNRTYQLDAKQVDHKVEKETTKGKISESHTDALKNIEASIQKQIEEVLEEIPIWTEFMKHVRGVGPTLAGGIIGYMYQPYSDKCDAAPTHKTCNCGKSIERFNNISKLHAYAGEHVVNGKAPRRTRGEKANWNPKLRTHQWKIGQSFIKSDESKSFYRNLYTKEKIKAGFIKTPNGWDMPKEIREQWIAKGVGHTNKIKEKLKKGEDVSKELDAVKGHLDARCQRKVRKLFLGHVWAKWRTLEGLPVTDPYPMTEMGGKHTGLITADEVLEWEQERK